MLVTRNPAGGGEWESSQRYMFQITTPRSQTDEGGGVATGQKGEENLGSRKAAEAWRSRVGLAVSRVD
jgi:hypothetical protein